MTPRPTSALARLSLAATLAACAASPRAQETAPAPEAASVEAPAPAATEFPPGSDDASRAAAAFERLSSLPGAWKGEFTMGEQKGPAEVRYRLTGGGSAIEETLFPGTPHEMVTMYHRDGPRLLLTHYCAAGNQPTMVLVGSEDPAVLRFDFVRASNLASPDAGHMHTAILDFSTPGRLRSSWTYWEGGRAGHAAVLDTERAK